ncbi:hypothetical protein, partial [Priestia megaterium]|uniref:hypothetical protein n=1 Tax=Priestia megaterium TaxID=1404 RepID=UPI001649A9BD
KGMAVKVIWGDKDLLEVVSEDVRVDIRRKGIRDVDWYRGAGIDEKYGMRGGEMIDMKGVMGER